MTVADLIESLKEMPQNAEVIIGLFEPLAGVQARNGRVFLQPLHEVLMIEDMIEGEEP